MRVFIHMDANGAYLGNGGFKALVNLAQATSEMGYETYAFDHKARLQTSDFDWLSWNELKFSLGTLEDVRGDDIIITSWISGGLARASEHHTVRYWACSELLRGRRNAQELCLDRCSRIAINNCNLREYYARMGFSDIICLDDWLRPLFSDRGGERDVFIGHQRGRGGGVYDELRGRFDDVLLCEGTQGEVAEKMNHCEFYVYWDEPLQMKGFLGETRGFSLYEGMACGCVCIGRRHDGNLFLEDTVVLLDDWGQAMEIIGTMTDQEKDKIRQKSLAFIRDNFRFDRAREQAIRELIR